MKVEDVSTHQDKTSDTDNYKGYFSIARVSQVIVDFMKRIFGLPVEL